MHVSQCRIAGACSLLLLLLLLLLILLTALSGCVPLSRDQNSPCDGRRADHYLERLRNHYRNHFWGVVTVCKIDGQNAWEIAEELSKAEMTQSIKVRVEGCIRIMVRDGEDPTVKAVVGTISKVIIFPRRIEYVKRDSCINANGEHCVTLSAAIEKKTYFDDFFTNHLDLREITSVTPEAGEEFLDKIRSDLEKCANHLR